MQKCKCQVVCWRQVNMRLSKRLRTSILETQAYVCFNWSTCFSAFCVNPSDGKNTFGVVDSHKGNDLRCKCSAAMRNKLENGGSNHWDNRQFIDEINRINVDHLADTHIKCKPSGNYQELQCVNETCICVDEVHGFPMTNTEDIIDQLLLSKKKQDSIYSSASFRFDKSSVITPAAVIYGAMNTLACCTCLFGSDFVFSDPFKVIF